MDQPMMEEAKEGSPPRPEQPSRAADPRPWLQALRTTTPEAAFEIIHRHLTSDPAPERVYESQGPAVVATFDEFYEDGYDRSAKEDLPKSLQALIRRSTDKEPDEQAIYLNYR